MYNNMLEEFQTCICPYSVHEVCAINHVQFLCIMQLPCALQKCTYLEISTKGTSTTIS